MTDSAAPEDALMHAALEVLRMNGPLATEELAEHLEDAGLGQADALVQDLEELPPHPLVLSLPDGRFAALDALFEGRVFTHRLSADEITRDLIAVDDVEPLLLLVSEDDDFELVAVDEQRDRLAERGVTYDDPLPPEVLLFPRGTFAGRSPGDLVALTAGGGRLSLVPVVADPTPVPALLAVLGRRSADGAAASLDDELLQVLADTPSAFTEPAPPLTEAIEAAGLERSGDLVAPEGFDFEGYISRTMFDEYADQLGIPVDAVPGVALFASLVDAIDSGDDADLEERFAEGKSGLFAVLADPEIAETVLDELIGEEFAPASIEQAALWLLDHAPRRSAAAAYWFAARAAEADGRITDAERLYEKSADEGGEFDLALFDLARYASDRGDAVRGLSLLSRIPGGDEHPLYDVLQHFQPVERPGLGRNDRCWCGSGRKYKVCHLGKADHPLSERAEWLYVKATMHALDPSWADERVALAEARAGYGDDDAVADAVHDPLVDDVLLHEAGAFADFVERRGVLLPEDEAELARRWTGVARSVFEVLDVRPGEGMALRDVRSDTVTEVHVPTITGELPAGTLLCARVLPAGELHVMPGGAEVVTEEQREVLLEMLGDDPVDAVDLVEALTGADAADFFASVDE
ncbi:SEC-C domain-containing protein [Rhodococcus sp. 105337]|uniref:SEC-C domain-containing protein n=1 Tax=Rhodococcus sp. 105337 TaxID=2725310 RepID=UPI003211E972